MSQGKIEPIEAAPASEVRFEREADVIVVGLGAAGTSAAIAAADGGASVLALERQEQPGGTSAMSGGLIYLGGGTALQQACGFRDSPESMERFLAAALGPGVDAERLHAYCVESVRHFEWLVAHGVPFRAAFCDEPNRESVDDSGLLFTGGEDSWPFDEIAEPAPRGHKPQFIDSSGNFLMQCLTKALSRTVARIEAGTRVERLVRDGERIVGVLAKTDAGTTALRARKAVVLAAGGFIYNEAMVAQHCPEAHRPDPLWRVGSAADDGSGIRLGLGAGAATSRMDSFECALPLGPPHRLARGVLVNASGERFINEDTYTGRIGWHALIEQRGHVFLIVDEKIYERNMIGLRPEWAAESPEELAADLGIPAERFAATMARYNGHAARGEDPDFHKRPPFLTPLGPGLAAIDLRVTSRAIYATFTLGGLATDAHGRALDAQGAVVAGLHAVGRTAASLAARGYASGISLGDGTFFGRRAGEHAAAS
ncbi:MAG: FAD-dependent oxidoreductase [Deltaproteobacteria bacterium]|nr:FAD-dependent oxidoreductase [Deltaproteobacteria bacterium]